MARRLSDPPTEDEVDALGAGLSRRVWVRWEGGAIRLVVCGPSGEEVVHFTLGPEAGVSWSAAPVVEAVRAFGQPLPQLIDAAGETESPQGILLGLEEHADYVMKHHPGVRIERGDILSLDPADWLD